MKAENLALRQGAGPGKLPWQAPAAPSEPEALLATALEEEQAQNARLQLDFARCRAALVRTGSRMAELLNTPVNSAAYVAMQPGLLRCATFPQRLSQRLAAGSYPQQSKIV